MTTSLSEQPPTVSVIMACHNGARHLADAIASVLAQRDVTLELLICDDGSTDESPAIAQRAAAQNDRVRVLRNDTPLGPGSARNLGLDEACGAWLAVVDADDLLHPDRFARLLQHAEAGGADVIADDLVPFGVESGTTLLAPLGHNGPWRPDAQALLRAEQGKPSVPVGYLKPLIRRAALGDLRYCTELPIGEDFDLLLRLALSGSRLLVLPEPFYFYRRHAASTSHRISPAQCEAMEARIDDLIEDCPTASRAILSELEAWRRNLRHQAAFGALVKALKARRLAPATRMMAGKPMLTLSLFKAATEGLVRRVTRKPGSARNLKPLVLATSDSAARGDRFVVPHAPKDWTPALAAALSKRTSCGARHIRAVGRPGLLALSYVPGWRLAEVIPPTDGWTPEEQRLIAKFPWPTTTHPQALSTAKSPKAA